MSGKAPDIDSRNAIDISRQVVELLKVYAPEWKDYDPLTLLPQEGLSAAITGSFARFCEIIIQRLNQVPNKNLLAFFDLLGASLQPPQPARVPLTFFPAAGNTNVLLIPAGTRVAAPPPQGEKDPVIFETEKELIVSPIQLSNLFSIDPAKDSSSDLSFLLQSTTEDWSVFEGIASDEHILLIGSNYLFGIENIESVDFDFTLREMSDHYDDRELIWERWNGTTWERIPQHHYSDSTYDLRYSGNIHFNAMSVVPPSTIDTIENRWIRFRLDRGITNDIDGMSGMVREKQIPKIRSISISVNVTASSVLPQYAASTNIPLDMSNPVFPFGEKPKFGDTFYLACDEVFSIDDNTVTIAIDLLNQKINPPISPTPIPPPANPSADLDLVWEYWNGTRWSSLTIDSDTTNKLSINGSLSFKIPASSASINPPSKRSVHGIEAYWIRARIARGNYGIEASVSGNSTIGFTYNPATFGPPIIKNISITYSSKITSQPDAVIIKNGFTYTNISGSILRSIPVRPFYAVPVSHPCFYTGFSLPKNVVTFPNKPLSFYVRLVEQKYGTVTPLPDEDLGNTPLLVVWEYWNGTGWSKLSVRDGTENMTRSGIIQFLPPADFTMHIEFNVNSFWIRAVWSSGSFKVPPRVKSILLNTVTALQVNTVREEILGSSDQSESQKFKTVFKPVLSGQKLMIRENEKPSAMELAVIVSEEGTDAVTIIDDAKGNPKEIWVCWHEVQDFYGSGPRDRHYCIDHLTGEILFGDNYNGMIPPQGRANVKMAFYKTGGGERGNMAVGSIIQLKTTLPYIEKVINSEASEGGSNAETIDSLLTRAPHTLRHGNRSVAIEDFEDLALLASTAVSRSKCFPLYDLKTDPYTSERSPGIVSVIIVPRSIEAKPVPTFELLDRVQNYLCEHCIPTADVQVVGPLYLRVDISVNIALSTLEGATAIEAEIGETFSAFLHPLTGGIDGRGWEFGRMPYKSDIYAQLKSIEGIDHIISLQINDSGDDPSGVIKNTGRFLVYSGNHTINLSFK